jgi:hypothetical protein
MGILFIAHNGNIRCIEVCKATDILFFQSPVEVVLVHALKLEAI